MPIYPKTYELMGSGNFDWANDTIQVMLCDETLAYNRTHQFVSDVVSTELSGGGYVRQSLASKTSADNGTHLWIFSAANALFTNVPAGQTAGSIVVLKQVTNDADSPVLCFLDPADLVANGSDITYQVPAGGVFNISYTTAS